MEIALPSKGIEYGIVGGSWPFLCPMKEAITNRILVMIYVLERSIAPSNTYCEVLSSHIGIEDERDIW